MSTTQTIPIEKIRELASRKGVKVIAVQNFLMSLDASNIAFADANLVMDAGLYKWNAATQKAIRDGIAFLKMELDSAAAVFLLPP